MSAPLWAAMPPVSVTAPAKVNLFLHITGRRADGYHELESLFAFTRGGDVVTVAAAPSFSFHLEGPFAGALEALGGAGAGNLVTKAAMLLASHAGLEPHVAITLKKSLPVAAGIGGGSSDAAAALLALNRFWKLNLPVADLESIGLLLGADVPACLHQRPLMVRGIGEDLMPVTLGWDAGILLVNPMVPLSTPTVFKTYKDMAVPFDSATKGRKAQFAKAASLTGTHNALEAPARAVCAEVRAVLATLEDLPGSQLARMSGSGATCFALFDSAAAAAKAAEKVRKTRAGWWVMADQLVAGNA